MSLDYRIGDVFDRLAEVPDGSIDLIVTSPPFLALRSYLPSDHPDKGKEIGSEATPADFLDTLLALSAEWGRVLAPHGSLCVELGDTYAGSGGAGGDYAADGLRAGQPRFRQGADNKWNGQSETARINGAPGGLGWPLAKSRTMIDTLYPACLAYGRNLLTGQPSVAGQWRIRNLIVWARPNPPVGALGDKFRPATSYITVACRSAKRYFDLDAVRVPYMHPDHSQVGNPTSYRSGFSGEGYGDDGQGIGRIRTENPAGAPPLDWHADHHPEDGDWLWKLSTQPYAGSHYATFPMALPKRLIEAMCPLRVCTVCGRPSERIVEATDDYKANRAASNDRHGSWTAEQGRFVAKTAGMKLNDRGTVNRENVTLGWSDCGHDDWRTGIVLDPFAGSGTTLEAAQAVGRHAIGIDLDSRNAELARSRVGMFLDIDEGATEVVA